VRVWIDFNNDAKFDGAGELVLSADNSLNASGSVLIPATAIKNVSLRIRVAADYSYSPAPTWCDSLEYGQAEDYSVVIKPNTYPPQADFAAKDSLSCSGIVKFTDKSQNVPTSWQWDFGDGTTSLVQNPVHTYTQDSTYTVTLIAVNVYGSDTIIKTVTVDLDRGPVAASCSPQTLGYCCGYGIYKVTFNTISNSTPDGSEGYKDFSCPIQTTVDEGQTYPITIQTGSGNPQDTRVWIDYNNDGILDNSTELAFSSNNSYNPSGNITVPSAVFDKPLRMRVTSDYTGSGITPCSNSTYGQTEDYTILIKSSITTGIKPFNKPALLSFYPNPAKEFFTITGKQHGTVVILIENAWGQIVYENHLDTRTNWEKIIDVSGFSKGIYFVRVVSGEDAETGKLLIGY
jgi:PKD repeat protein